MKSIVVVIAILIYNISIAQKDSLDLKPVFGINVHAGTLTYYGYLNNRVLPFNSVNKLSYGASASLKYNALSLNFNYDNLNMGHELNTRKEHKNFKAEGNFYGLDINYWPIIKKNYGLFVGTGITYFNYSVKSDTLDSKGNKYYYWSDGTIRDKTENEINKPSATKINRDYNYETEIGDVSFLSYPLRLGVMLRVIKDVQVVMTSNFYFTNKNNAEAIKVPTKQNNYFLYNTVGVTYYFNKHNKTDQTKYKSINFKEIWLTDEDKDGVKDSEDKCFGTPKGIKVDKYGCPLDDDKDEIPDYLDKEKNTGKNKLIDLNGIGQEPGDPIKFPIPDEE